MAGKIKTWSTTPGSNNQTPPAGWPEGMAPSQVNDTARQGRASVREWYEDAEWIDYGHTIFSVVGQNVTLTGDLQTVYRVGRSIRQNLSSIGFISAVSLVSGNTQVTVAGFVPAAVPTAIEVGIVYSSLTRLVSGNSSISLGGYSGNALVRVNGSTIGTYSSTGLNVSALSTPALTATALTATTLTAETVTITGGITVAPATALPTVLEIGYQGGSAQTTALDFHTGATAVDYDSRLEFTGGTGVSAGGAVDVKAASFSHNGRTFLNVLSSGNISAVGDTTIAIPAGSWRRLALQVSGLKTATDFVAYLRFNTDATAGAYAYTQRIESTTDEGNLSRLNETGAALSRRDSLMDDSVTTTNPLAIFIELVDVTAIEHKAGFYKSTVRSSGGNQTIASGSILWRNNGAITSLQILLRNATGASPSGGVVNATAGTFVLTGELGTL